MMRYGTLVLLFCCCGQVLSQAAPVSARDRAKRQLAVRAAAQQIVWQLQAPATLEDAEQRELVAALSAQMQAHVEAHSVLAGSRKRCRRWLQQQRRQGLDESIDTAVSRAREHTALPVSRADVLRHVGDDWKTQLTAAAESLAVQHLDQTFGAARQQSVALQRDALRHRIRRPPQAALDARLTALEEATGQHPPRVADIDRLVDWVASWTGKADTPLFEEVRQSIQDAARVVVQDIKSQYNRQRTAQKKAAAALPASALVADTIQKVLLNTLEAAIAGQRRQAKAQHPDAEVTIYDPFTVIRKAIEQMAADLETARLEAAIRTQTKLPLEVQALRRAVRTDLAAHRSDQNSRQILVSDYTRTLQPWFVDRLASRAERSDDAAFCKTLTAAVSTRKRLQNAIQARVGNALDQLLPGVRNAIAAEQMESVFGQSPEAIETLAPAAVERLWAAGQGKKVKAFPSAWQTLQMAGVIENAEIRDTLLNETRTRVVAVCNRLVPAAARAMRAQANLLADLERDWTPRLEQEVDAGRSVQSIIAAWTQELTQRWQPYAENEAIPYTQLFERTRALLDKTVRKLFEARQSERDAADEKTAESSAEQEPVEEPPPEPEETPEEATTATIADMLETLDFVLYFRDLPHDRTEAVLLAGGGSAARKEFSPGDVKAAVETIYGAIIPAIKAAAQGKSAKQSERSGFLSIFQRDRSLELKMAVLVGSRQVRHMTSILLRNRVEIFVADWNADPANPSLELQWEDNLDVAK